MGIEWLLFPTSPLLLRYEMHDFIRQLAIPNHDVATFLMTFKAHVNILDLIEVKLLC